MADAMERLDTIARGEMSAEQEGHAETLRGLRAGDREAFAAEVDRHLERVAAILLAHARRHPATAATLGAGREREPPRLQQPDATPYSGAMDDGDSMDAQARRELETEGAEHRLALKALPPGGRRAFEAEMSRHLRRVDDIYSRHSDRRPA